MKERFKTPLCVSEKSPWESHLFSVCGQISGLDAVGSKWQQRGKHERETDDIYSEIYSAGFHFPLMINFVFHIVSSQPLKVWRCFFPTILAKCPGCTQSFVESTALLLILQNWNKITGSAFTFLDIHLLNEFFHQHWFHPASPTYAEWLTSVQWLTQEKPVGWFAYSIYIMIQNMVEIWI